MPKELGKKETELIVFRSKSLGSWKYMIFGIGVPPTDFELVKISAFLLKPQSQMISFKNPFQTDILIQIELEQEEPVFDLIMMKSKGIMIRSGAVLQFNIRFTPPMIKNYQGKILIKLNPKIHWCYPLSGITEAPTCQ